MKIVTLTPSPLLTSLVKQMWIIEENAGFNVKVKSFPTGYAFINVISGEEFKLKKSGKPVIKTKSYVTGQCIEPFDLSMCLIRRSLVVNLQAYAFYTFFGIPLSELKGHVYSLKEIAPRLASELEELLEGNLQSSSVLKATDKLFTKYLKNNYLDLRLKDAVNQIMFHKGNISTKKLSETANLSQRRMQQLFKTHVGVSPKTYNRITRLQSLSFQVLNGKKLDYFVPDNYFDQAHFIHDIKSQTGMTPTEYNRYITAPELCMAYLKSNPYAS